MADGIISTDREKLGGPHLEKININLTIRAGGIKYEGNLKFYSQIHVYRN